MTALLLNGWRTILLAFAALLVLPTIATAAATTDFVEFFKYTYGTDRLLYLAALESVLLRILKRRMKPVSGRGQWILPIQTRNTGHFVGHAEGGAKTTRRAQPAGDEATFSLQEFHGVWDASWKMLQDARRDEYSFGRAVDFMDTSYRRRTFRLINADLCGTGKGELGILSAADNQTTITVRALPLVDMGMLVDLMDTDNNTINGPDGTAVTAIDAPNRTITTATAGVGTAASDYFTIADSVSSAGSLHMLGIRAWIDSADPDAEVGDIGGIDRGTAGTEWWESLELANAGTNRPLTEDLLLQGYDGVREVGGVEITDLMSNLAIIRRYHETLRADVFFALGAVKPLGDTVGLGRSEASMKSGEQSMGETPYAFGPTPWRAEMFFDANTVIGFNRTHFFIGHGENEMPQSLSEIFGEDMITYFTSTVNTTFEVVSYWQAELIGDQPTAHFKANDIAES